jgi:hypothetical protein
MGLVDRAKNILLKPKEEWEVIASEPPNTGAILTGYVLPFVVLAAALMILMTVLFGGMDGLIMGVAVGLMLAVIVVISVLLNAFVINALAPNFDSQKDMGRAVQLVAYSITPQLVGSVLLAIPILGFLIFSISGFYSIYLMYLGFTPIMKTPQDKVVVYMIVALLALYIGVGILFAIFSAIIFGALGLGAAAIGAGAGAY